MTADLRTQLESSLGSTYSTEGELGDGGMSRVFLAHDAPVHGREHSEDGDQSDDRAHEGHIDHGLQVHTAKRHAMLTNSTWPVGARHSRRAAAAVPATTTTTCGSTRPTATG